MNITSEITSFLAFVAAVLGGGSFDPATQPHASSCPLNTPDSTLTMRTSGCSTVFSDTSSDSDPLELWGRLDCASADRHRQVDSGGDPRPRADGTPQGDSALRRLTVLDGDDYYGERCELGENDRDGPTALYREGTRRATFMSFRLPTNFPLGVFAWQGGMQMKQVQPAENGGGTPVLSLSAYDDEWRLFHSDAGYTDVDDEIWHTPAQPGIWTRFAFDVVYSHRPSEGSIKVYVDLNADGDFADSNEQSDRIQTNTLKTETGTDDSDGLSAGDPIPSHLRNGLYHDAAIECPAPNGCSVEVDNVQVLAP